MSEKGARDVLFLPPEALGEALDLADEDLMMDLASASDWDIATRYHEFKMKPGIDKNRKLGDHLRSISVDAVLRRAQTVLGSVVRPVENRVSPLSEVPPLALQPELDLEETLENSPLAFRDRIPVTAEDLWMGYQTHRRQGVVLSVDTSLSMTGEKLALTAVALAVVLLQFPEDPIGIVAFENEARVLKWPHEEITLHELLERFLDVPAQGYTHLENGMKTALRLVKDAQRAGSGRPSTVLLTDGKYTAGRDPAYLGGRFPHLVVLKMGPERASRELCREMARRGKGTVREIVRLEDLPDSMYSIVKDLLRGKSAS